MEAEELYLKAASLGLRVVNVYVGLGEAYRAQGKIEDARQAYERALEIDPNNADARRLLALVGG